MKQKNNRWGGRGESGISPRPLIVALDVDSLKEASRFVKLLKSEVTLYKVGSVLFTATGPDAVRMIHDEGGTVFLDLKFHDIPNTVARSCEAAASLGVCMLNVHASGGREMMEAAVKAVRAANSPAILLGVTVLTSTVKTKNTLDEVVRLAGLSQESGLNGVVCSGHEIEAVRKRCGKDFVIVTPGIRPENSEQRKVPLRSERSSKGEKRWGAGGESGISPAYDDQQRVVTPMEAIRKGADYLVVGRPILSAREPLRVVQDLLQG